MKRSRRLGYALFIFFCLSCTYFFCCVRDHILYERFLNSQFITFNDFPHEYEEAVRYHFRENIKETMVYNFTEYPLYDTSNSIPAVVHFIWFRDLYEVHKGGPDMAHKGSNAPDYCKSRSPGFEVNIWDADAARKLIEENYAWFIPTYDAYRYPIQRVDAFKYFLLLHHGGVYMDMDISCRRSLIPLLQYPAWFPRASPSGVNIDLMAARPGHPVIKKMTETLQSRNKDLISPWLTIFWSTGPRFTTDVLKMWFEEHASDPALSTSNKPDDPDRFYILPSYFYSEDFTFFGHRAGGSWYGSDVAVILWILARPWIAEVLLGVIVLTFLIVMLRSGSVRRTLASYLRRWNRQQTTWAEDDLTLKRVESAG